MKLGIKKDVELLDEPMSLLDVGERRRKVVYIDARH